MHPTQHHQHESLAHELRQKLRQWQNENPDWEDYADLDPSQIRDARILKRRQQCHQVLVDMACMGIQRHFNAHLLPHDPERHWTKTYFQSELMTMAQHARGQKLTLPKHGQDMLATAFQVFDDHFFGNLVTDVMISTETWLTVNIKQPASHALGLDKPKRNW
jgi:hypothetical protein